MKLKLPNGFRLYLWDSEASMIDVTEGIILITLPSGKELEIRVPDHWMNESQIRTKDDPPIQSVSTKQKASSTHDLLLLEQIHVEI